jgi:glutathione peroxidase-family protein
MAGRKKKPLPDSIYEIPITDAKGDIRTLGEYKGDVLLIVNTASY